MKISQREARRLRKLVNELQRKLREQRTAWGQEYPDGKHILTLGQGDEMGVEDVAVIRTARTLGHTVVVTHHGNSVHFHGVN